MCGFAFGLLNLNVFSVAVMKHMPPNLQGLAVGFTTSGSTFGQFALVPLFTLASSTYGWRYAYVILSLFTFSLVLPSVLLLRESKNRQYIMINRNKNDNNNNDSNSSNDTNNNNSNSSSNNNYDTDNNNNNNSNFDSTNNNNNNFDSNNDYYSIKIDKEVIDTDLKKIDIKMEVSSVLRSHRYWGLALSFFICGITTTGFIESHFVSFFVDKDIQVMEAALGFSVLSACNGAAVLVTGYLSDHYNKYIILSIIFVVRALAYIFLLFGFSETLPYAIKLLRLYVFAALFGFVDYSVVPPTVGLIKGLAPNFVGFLVGMLLLVHSIGASIGSYLGGIIYEEQKSYNNAVIICLIVCTIASIICFMIKEQDIKIIENTI